MTVVFTVYQIVNVKWRPYLTDFELTQKQLFSLKKLADSLFSSCSFLSAKNGFTQLYFSKDLFPLCYEPHFSWVFNRRACFSKRGREEQRFGSVGCGCGSGGLYGSPNWFQSWLLLAAVLSICGTGLFCSYSVLANWKMQPQSKKKEEELKYLTIESANQNGFFGNPIIWRITAKNSNVFAFICYSVLRCATLKWWKIT